jgi:hypothetical protein
MDLNNLEEEFKSQAFDVNNTSALMEILKRVIINEVRIEKMYEELISIHERLKGKTESEIDDYFEEGYLDHKKDIEAEIQARWARAFGNISKAL